jgi:hypothetical protein
MKSIITLSLLLLAASAAADDQYWTRMRSAQHVYSVQKSACKAEQTFTRIAQCQVRADATFARAHALAEGRRSGKWAHVDRVVAEQDARVKRVERK